MKVFHFKVEFLGLRIFSVLTKNQGSLLSHQLSHCSHLMMVYESSLIALSYAVSSLKLCLGHRNASLQLIHSWNGELVLSLPGRRGACERLLCLLGMLCLISGECPWSPLPAMKERWGGRIRVRPDKTGMRFLLAYFSIFLALRWRLYIYISFAFFCLSGWPSQIQCSTRRGDWPAEFLKFMTWFGT